MVNRWQDKKLFCSSFLSKENDLRLPAIIKVKPWISTSSSSITGKNPPSAASFSFQWAGIRSSHSHISDEISPYDNDDRQVFSYSVLDLRFRGGPFEEKGSVLSNLSISDQYIYIPPMNIQIQVHLCNFCMRDTTNILDADPFSPWTFSCIGNRGRFFSLFSPFEKFFSTREYRINRIDPANPTTWDFAPGFAHSSSSGRLLFFLRSLLCRFFLWCCLFCHFQTSFYIFRILRKFSFDSSRFFSPSRKHSIPASRIPLNQRLRSNPIWLSISSAIFLTSAKVMLISLSISSIVFKKLRIRSS